MNNKRVILEELEGYRKEALKWTMITIATFAIGALLAITGFFFLVLVGIIPAIISGKKNKEFKMRYKNYFLASQFEEVFETPVNVDLNGYSESKIKNSYLIPEGNRFYSDDLISLEYKGVKINRGDVTIQTVTSTGKTTTTVTNFQGQYMVFSFPKNITEFMVIKENAFFGNKPGGMFSNCPKTSKVEFESIEFNKMFDVYASNEHEAFYLLTPQFMQVIMDFRKKNSHEVYFGFMNNEFHVAVNMEKNLFEPSILKPVTTSDSEFDKGHIYDLKDMIEQFRLMEE